MVNYTEEVKSSVLDWIRDNYENKEICRKLRDREEWEQELNDDLFDSDSVTGNASGSFFFNAFKAKEMWLECDETEAQDMIDEFCIDMNEHWCDYEYLDVYMRCYVLGGAISEALDELEEECEDEEELIYYLRSDIKGILDGIKAFESVDIYFYKDGEITTTKRLHEDFVCEWYGRLNKNANELIQDIIDEITYDNENICFD